MDKLTHPLAATLRWFALFWLVGWSVYVTRRENSSSLQMDEMIVALAALLIPVALAFGVSWVLDRFPWTDLHGGELAEDA